jgi:signal transduction histidine kinase
MNHTRMSLRRRMIVHVGLMVGGSLLIGLAAVLGINSLHQDMGLAIQGYQELRQVYEVGFHVAQARDALDSDHPDLAKAEEAVDAAAVKLDEMDYDGGFGAPSPYWLDESTKESCRRRLAEASERLKIDSDTPADLEMQRSSLNNLLSEFSGISADIRVRVLARQNLANQKRREMLALVIALAGIIVATVVVVGFRQYRAVVRPLDRLGQGVRAFAAGRFSSRIDTRGDREFAALARDFNSMASELESLYLDLERKVAAKSKELAKSQRLASVGFLAAGVAHEINNPLSIIAGYGERSLQLLGERLDRASLPRTREAIQIMCDEAFRCKQITGRLLSLARPTVEERQPVALNRLVEQVISHVGGLAEEANQRITLDAPSGEDFAVSASEGEMKQVIVNLVVNGLEALTERSGTVSISLRRAGDEIELSVSDNGRGMSADILERVFEPFFTDKRGQRHGTGLGLSITHAIVADHGGSISAQSDGPGSGSRFVVRLPAAHRGAEVADA